MSRASVLSAGVELAPGRPYAERSDKPPAWHDRLAEYLVASTVRPVRRSLRDPARSLRVIVPHVERHDRAMRAASDVELMTAARGMRARLRLSGFTLPLVGECFALVREAASRVLGNRHYDTQLMAGWALLRGKLVEMATGEGKTFAATLPAATVAMAGYPVHVITVNDYLAERDAAEMGPLYNFLGLSAGAVIQGMQRADRRKIYARSIAYCTNKELAFDYLRDGVALSERSSPLHMSIRRLRGDPARETQLVLRGLYFAIVDEADSVFIDEARTPLILSASTGSLDEKEHCERALEIAAGLTHEIDYRIEWAERGVNLEDDGRAAIAAACRGLGGVWTSSRAREELVTQALTAQLLFKRDQHYVVAEDKVQIVDESTGRVMPDRSWERGLHQLIEVKEGCEPTERRETLGRLTYQRLFRRYVLLSGMTGTAREVAREIRAVYGLDVVRVPLHRPSRRRHGPTLVCLSREEKWQLIADRVARLAQDGRPVLIGTRSVGASEEISAVLAERSIAHALLNAKQDDIEAEIVAQAGQSSRVTVATNMAGRGTDIRLAEGVEPRGGLHVILTEFHESRRIDRQLFGRSARQGDRGSCEAVVALDDEIYRINAPCTAQLLRGLLAAGIRLPAPTFRMLKWLAQEAAERRAATLRAYSLRTDRRLDQMLAFSGRGE